MCLLLLCLWNFKLVIFWKQFTIFSMWMLETRTEFKFIWMKDSAILFTNLWLKKWFLRNLLIMLWIWTFSKIFGIIIFRILIVFDISIINLGWINSSITFLARTSRHLFMISYRSYLFIVYIWVFDVLFIILGFVLVLVLLFILINFFRTFINLFEAFFPFNQLNTSLVCIYFVFSLSFIHFYIAFLENILRIELLEVMQRL